MIREIVNDRTNDPRSIVSKRSVFVFRATSEREEESGREKERKIHNSAASDSGGNQATSCTVHSIRITQLVKLSRQRSRSARSITVLSFYRFHRWLGRWLNSLPPSLSLSASSKSKFIAKVFGHNDRG